MKIQIEREDLRRWNRLQAELKQASAAVECFHCQLEEKYDIVLQLDTVDMVTGVIEKEDGNADNH